jgi:hypothetical protein
LVDECGRCCNVCVFEACGLSFVVFCGAGGCRLMGVTAGYLEYSNVVDLYNYTSGTLSTSSTTAAPTTTLTASPTTAVAVPSTTLPASPTTSVNVGIAVGASVGGVIFVVLLVAAVWRWRKYLSQVHSCSLLFQFCLLQMHVFYLAQVHLALIEVEMVVDRIVPAVLPSSFTVCPAHFCYTCADFSLFSF